MMLRLFVVITLFNLNIDEVRQRYQNALSDSKTAETLFSDLNAQSSPQPLILAYKGATRAVMAQYALSPASKLEYVREGSGWLDDAVIQDPNDMEIRYLRYTVERSMPAFLPYRTHLAQDSQRLTAALISGKHGLTPEIADLVIRFLLKNAELEPAQRKKLESLI